KIFIHRQLLKALISANILLSFVENSEVIKLFNILNPKYKLPSRKWLSTDILDNIYENIQLSIQNFMSDAKFLTLSGDRWTNVSKNRDNIFTLYKEIGMNLGDKWIAFISDSGSDFKKAQKLIRKDHEICGLNPIWLLYIQEAAYGLFCTIYPNYNQDGFIDEWLNYSNQEAPNLSEFAYRFLSIPPNSATSEWQNQEVSQTLYETKNNICNEDDYINDSDDIDDFMNSLNQMSEKLIGDIQLFTDINSEETIPTLIN
ncbi:20678_t:CDS:2, partial [Funneliformis geosporum]